MNKCVFRIDKEIMYICLCFDKNNMILGMRKLVFIEIV